MADNPQRYGFRWVRSLHGGRNPVVERMIVATSQSFDVNGGASNVNLGPGDPVRKLSTGGVGLCDGAEGAAGALAPYGVVMSVGPYWNGTEMIATGLLPSDTAWGTNLARQSVVYVCPFDSAVWEIDVDDITTAATKAAYQAFIGENADYRLNGASGETRAYPRLDISSHATTNSLVCRIVGISETLNNQDFAEDYVKLLIRANLAQVPTHGSVAAPTTNDSTGV